MKKRYVIETLTTFRINYLVQSENEIKQSDVQNLIDKGKIPELQQEFLGEKIVGVYESDAPLSEIVIDLDKPLIEDEVLDES